MLLASWGTFVELEISELTTYQPGARSQIGGPTA